MPSLVKYYSTKPSTIQIATRNSLCVLDVLDSNPEGEKLCRVFFDRLLGEKTILKLGLGLKGDLSKLKSQYEIKENYVRNSCIISYMS